MVPFLRHGQSAFWDLNCNYMSYVAGNSKMAQSSCCIIVMIDSFRFILAQARQHYSRSFGVHKTHVYAGMVSLTNASWLAYTCFLW